METSEPTGANGHYKGWLKVMTWNVNGLRTRMPELKTLLEAQKPEVVAYQESMMEEVPYSLRGYKHIGLQGERTGEQGDNRWEGGIGMFVKAYLQAKVLPSSLGNRVLWVRLKGKKRAAVVIGVVYGPAKKQEKNVFWTQMELELKEVIQTDKVILMEDFNICLESQRSSLMWQALLVMEAQAKETHMATWDSG